MKFTDRTLASLEIPPTGQKFYADETPGLYIRTSCGGSKSFLFIYGKQRRKITLGRWPLMTLAIARSECRRLMAENTLGTLAPSSIKFKDAFELYIVQYKTKNRSKTAKDHEWLLRRHFDFGHSALDTITRADIVAIIDGLAPTPSLATHVLTASKTFFNWCIRRGYIQNSPCSLLQAPQRHEEAGRVLSDAELATVLKHAQSGQHQYHKIVLLLAYTGQRPKDIASLKREWVTEDLISYPTGFMKNRLEHFVPITPTTAEILNTLPSNGLLFPSSENTPFSAWSKNQKKLITACGFHFEKYDLRRTFSTRAAEWRCGPPHAVELLMNHKAPSSLGSKIARIYNRHTYLDDLRSTLHTYEKRLNALTA